jgi:hypothetical protein
MDVNAPLIDRHSRPDPIDAKETQRLIRCGLYLMAGLVVVLLGIFVLLGVFFLSKNSPIMGLMPAVQKLDESLRSTDQHIIELTKGFNELAKEFSVVKTAIRVVVHNTYTVRLRSAPLSPYPFAGVLFFSPAPLRISSATLRRLTSKSTPDARTTTIRWSAFREGSATRFSLNRAAGVGGPQRQDKQVTCKHKHRNKKDMQQRSN